MKENELIEGDAQAVLQRWPDNFIDAIVTDPPAGISFMGKAFDSDRGGRMQWVAWLAAIMTEALRCLKPGGHALVWSLPRTSHWTACALEDAGFEIRDCVYHVQSQGFPKSLNISKALDRVAGATREVIGTYERSFRPHGTTASGWARPSHERAGTITTAATVEAQQWDGWGSGLKPAAECWWLCRKPLAEPTIAANIAMWGVGALNIDACRVPYVTVPGGTLAQNTHLRAAGVTAQATSAFNAHGNTAIPRPEGRFPPNVLLSHTWLCTEEQCDAFCPIRALDAQSGTLTSGTGAIRRKAGFGYSPSTYGRESRHSGTPAVAYGDSGGASRFFPQFRPGADDLPPFFYTGKAAQTERTAGGLVNNSHPTVKPLALMRYLVRLVTPSGGSVLDCFAGSGSTLVACVKEGFRFFGIEQDAAYVAIARARLAQVQGLWTQQDDAISEVSR